jgi:hypothetical protein
MSSRAIWTDIHGLLFGTFFLLSVYGLLLEVFRMQKSSPLVLPLWERALLVVGACSGWAAVLTGTFLVYPWYRTPPQAGATLADHPKFLLLANASTAPLHSIGMEWKEHIALLAPLAFTASAYLWIWCRPQLLADRYLRRGVVAFTSVALLATAVAGVVGAFLNKFAPIGAFIVSPGSK